ncbi:hypothetical protein [Streptomyces sp. NPDC088350]
MAAWSGSATGSAKCASDVFLLRRRPQAAVAARELGIQHTNTQVVQTY